MALDPRPAAIVAVLLPALVVAAPAGAAPGKARDTDGDGLGDRFERRSGTNPRKRDTDGDGLSDPFERRLGSDPRDPADPRPRHRALREPPPSAEAGPAASGASPPPATPPALPACTLVVESLAGVQSAVAAAAPGAVVCLADGVYARLALTATKAAPGVTVRAEHPGQATLAGATVSGSTCRSHAFGSPAPSTPALARRA